MLSTEELRDFVVTQLENQKALDIQVIDVRGKTSITDIMVIASGTSNRHVKAIADTLVFQTKQHGEQPLGTEGTTDGEWALVDLNAVVVHVMQPKVREFYQIERLWMVEEEE